MSTEYTIYIYSHTLIILFLIYFIIFPFLRERKGPFKNIEELVKVRGISARVLSILKVYLTVNNVPPASPPISDVISVASYSRVYQRNLDVKMPGKRWFLFDLVN